MIKDDHTGTTECGCGNQVDRSFPYCSSDCYRSCLRSAAAAPRRETSEDREYALGVADAKRYANDRKFYGHDLAEEWEMEREMREDW